MHESTMNTYESDLLTLMTPFLDAEDKKVNLQNEAQALLTLVDNLLKSDHAVNISQELWHNYLDITGRPNFLSSLDGPDPRLQWADHMFRIVDDSQYTLLDMIEQRVQKHPERALFREADNGPSLWSYEQVFSYMKRIAAAFYTAVEQPRVLLYLENSPEGACADLACLAFGILDSPIDRHFDRDTIAYIIGKLGINIVVTDTESRLHRLNDVQNQTGIKLKIFVIIKKTISIYMSIRMVYQCFLKKLMIIVTLIMILS